MKTKGHGLYPALFPTRPPPKNKNIRDIARAAAEAGMSYGKYVATLEEEKTHGENKTCGAFRPTGGNDAGGAGCESE